MYRALALSVSIAAMTWAVTASADDGFGPPRLRGAYGFTGAATCLVAPGNVSGATPLPNPTPGVALPNSGFNAQLQPNDVNPGPTASFGRSFSVEGIRVFHGDGTGTVKGTAVGVAPRPTPGPTGFPHFPPSAAAADFSYSFTYTVNPDGSWTSTMVPGSYTETYTAGPRTGQTATIDAIPPVSGMISQDGNTLTGAHLAATVEVHTYSNGDVDPQICDRSRIFIKLQGFGDGDHD